MDVSGYPPLYDKRCETPVVSGRGPGKGRILSGDEYTVTANDKPIATYDDILKSSGLSGRNARFYIKDGCSWRFFRATKPTGDGFLFTSMLKGSGQQGRVEFQCHDRDWKKKGEVTTLDLSLDDDLPQWIPSDVFREKASVSLFIIVELNDMWCSTSCWLQCGANVTFRGGPVRIELIFQYNITGCPEDRYGVECDKKCVCKNGARCHGFSGACECRPGWRGRACDVPWPEVVITATPGDSVSTYIGTNLALTCVAPHIQVANMTWLYQAGHEEIDSNISQGVTLNNSINFQPVTDSSNGRYTCIVKDIDGKDFSGTFVMNATECLPNYHGNVCSQVCDCQYGGTCGRWEGCVCTTGRHGDKCEDTCAPGRFGLNCSMTCYCQNEASCDPVNGTCICAAGQSGEFCQNIAENRKTVLIVLTTALPSIFVVGCIVIITLRRQQNTGKSSTGETNVDLNVETMPLIEILSPWEVDKEDLHLGNMIGEGEFGHVVRGRLRIPEGYQVLVAAKSIRPDRMTASVVRDFEREMSILARIHEDKEGHPNVVRFYGAVTKSEPQYILVEYASNEDLRRFLWSLREDFKITRHKRVLERLGFAADVASGLSELARLKIVHRDIAARNVVISDRMVAKIADFGLSRDVYVSSAYARTNQGGEDELLPLKWMAVESLRDGVYTCESDVWSYGVLLWEIASFGEEPRYAGGPMHPDVCTLLELLRKNVRLQQPHNCPQHLYRIVRSCWIVDPSKRPTPEELVRKIKDLMKPLMPPRHAHLFNHDIQ
ncbi:uncharacterized protein [Branchiostoma lanceolatum]|uniref:uncharacterized protein n=1 Tax=Branchiostoma lanceolatum TaxID=7740 RepID=UPI003456EBE0